MTRIHDFVLSAVIVLLLLTAGCTIPPNTSPSPGVTQTVTSAVTTSEPVTAGTTQTGAVVTQGSGTCTADIGGDAANCGGCGYACPANAVCLQGQCFCREGFIVENNLCVVAPAGTITGTGCPAGMSPCPDGYCYELASSAGNCGACGNVCSAGMICSSSVCTSVPTEATTAVPVTTTASVTTTSAPPTTTISGLHVVTTAAVGPATLNCVILGKTNCGNTCVNLSSSLTNCGACGKVCKSLTPACCNGVCVNLLTDSSNCGTCGHTCSFSTTCTAGSCTIKAGITSVVTKIAIPVTYKVVEPVQIPIPPVQPGI